jgi:signal transduction histidine kinase
MNFINGVPDTKRLIFSNLKDLLSNDFDAQTFEAINIHQDTLHTVFYILEMRVQELLARIMYPGMWTTYRLNELESNYKAVLKAVEKNSYGSYKIVYNVAVKGANDYLVNLALDSVKKNTISIPSVFIDVMRDIILNARKYTPLGGNITTGLYDDGNLVSFEVEDDGMGIPDSQINQVVNFGVRADNVLNKKTMGGGFGLTKAYYVTQQYSGRMWIETEINVGTKIIIELPCPSN